MQASFGKRDPLIIVVLMGVKPSTTRRHDQLSSYHQRLLLRFRWFGEGCSLEVETVELVKKKMITYRWVVDLLQLLLQLLLRTDGDGRAQGGGDQADQGDRWMEPSSRRPRGAAQMCGRKEKGRVGWRQSPWRPKCEEEEDERKIETGSICYEARANMFSAASSVHVQGCTRGSLISEGAFGEQTRLLASQEPRSLACRREDTTRRTPLWSSQRTNIGSG